MAVINEKFIIIQDSDDDVNKPVLLPEKEFLSSIHHVIAS